MTTVNEFKKKYRDTLEIRNNNRSSNYNNLNNSSDILNKLLDNRYSQQMDIFRVTLIQGNDTYVGFIHEYTSKIIRNPIYKDIDPSIFIPDWYTVDDMYNFIEDIAKDFDLFENPQFKIAKVNL